MDTRNEVGFRFLSLCGASESLDPKIAESAKLELENFLKTADDATLDQIAKHCVAMSKCGGARTINHNAFLIELQTERTRLNCQTQAVQLA